MENQRSMALLLLFGLTLAQLLVFSESTALVEKIMTPRNKKQEKVVPVDEVVLNRIHDFVKKYALKLDKDVDINRKKKMVGVLPDSYPKEMRMKAGLIHKDTNRWNRIMRYPTRIWRFCVYPINKLNPLNWCDNNIKSLETAKLHRCKNTFCNVCCGHIELILKNQANHNILGKLLNLNNDSGFRNIKKAISSQDINKCRVTCDKTFPTNKILILPPPPRDSKLGKTSSNPGMSCQDIKKWGDKKVKSGKFWIKMGSKGVAEVYCDMETDGGGWTLFFNYLHYPKEEFSIDNSKFPENLQKNSHMNLIDSGIHPRFIKQLRFFCSEKSDRKYFWHFKTSSSSFLQVALSGNQRLLKPSALTIDYKEMPFPGKTVNWVRAVNKEEGRSMSDFNFNKAGGFWDSPFGSKEIEKYWTVKGTNPHFSIFECGTQRRKGNGKAYGLSNVTHHTVWFRGDALSNKEARERYVKSTLKLK